MKPQLQNISIGKLTGVFGLKGELVLRHALGNTGLEGLEKILIKDKAGSLIPWFVTTTRVKNDEEVYLKTGRHQHAGSRQTAIAKRSMAK